MNYREMQLVFRIGIVKTLKKLFPSRTIIFLKNSVRYVNAQWEQSVNNIWERMPTCIQGFWYRRQWWIALWERKILSEKWLDERRWKCCNQEQEQRFWLQMISWRSHLNRPLSVGEWKKLEEYERRYSRIKVFFVFSTLPIMGYGYDYNSWVNESRQDDKAVCRVVYFEEGIESPHITPNSYLTDKLRASFPTITRENHSFWYTFLMKNRKRVVVKSTVYYFSKQYGSVQSFFTTGEQTIHPSAVTFSEKEVQLGQDAMQRMGIVNPYICIFARDARYNNEMRNVIESGGDLRNSDINSFQLTTQYFWGKHVQTVRMGALVATKYCHEGAVDYANHGRTDFLDVFIFSRCRFFIGDCSGIYGLAYLQNIPWAAINIPFPLNFDDRIQEAVVGIYLKVYDVKNKRFLRLREIAEMQIHYYANLRLPQATVGEGWDSYIYRNHKVIHNTPEEILDLAKEMEALQTETIKYTEYDEKLQQRYRSIMRTYLRIYPTVTCPIPCRLGMKWLRDNEWFLE